jgi:pimeloyl-ACP methyl ester carboxylesterase
MVRTVDIMGFPHAYELSAPTDSSIVLVFIHGWLLSHTYWHPVIEQLSSDYQCLSYDLRGFGASQPRHGVQQTSQAAAVLDPKSEWITVGAVQPQPAPNLRLELLSPTALPTRETASQPPAKYTPVAYANDLTLLLQELKISKAWLVGHSLGGSIALWAAHQAPEAIAGVICVNSGGGIYLKEEFERFRSAGEQLVKFRPRWLAYLPLLDLALTRLNVARPIARRWGKQRLQDLISAHPEAALGTLLDSTTEAEVHRLPQVVSCLQQPVHFIAGADDTVMEPKYVNHLASFHSLFQCCGNNVSEIPNCGHLAMVEQPEAVAKEIRSVLSKYVGTRG